ncbi:integral membrane protein GPR137 isoform X2 [Austrofundulus limnaeus]|uniref:Integral membrane protein GPR137 isoform X2 n=1 Tax=Austrofundulus limnaeus TaxID=52670 RepID=A0A2I4CSX2_AUSLI|nr:PREDICTED: integral membrane protein GPR137-like isoform X2 [Austrofundulus limnaeus]
MTAPMEVPVGTAPLSNFSVPPPSPLRPAIAPSVQLGFTILFTSLYVALFLVVYIQLWLLFFYKHKRWSYQSIFLFLCLLWATLRATLFSFYFYDATEANRLPVVVFWLLYCFPVCLQFFTFSLINLYLTQVLFKIRESFSSAMHRGLWVARCAYSAFSVIFLCVNVSCAVLGDRDGSMLLAAVLLILTRHSRSASPYMINKGTTVCRTAALGAAVIILFTSRACYNLAVLVLSKKYPVESFNYDWYNVSDQADLQKELGDRGYIAFGVILFIWELIPTSLLILILRVRRPAQDTSSMAVNNRVLPRPYFFDDPQGSDDDIPAPWDKESVEHSSWCGSETAPLLFTNNPSEQSHQHHSFYSTPQN